PGRRAHGRAGLSNRPRDHGDLPTPEPRRGDHHDCGHSRSGDRELCQPEPSFQGWQAAAGCVDRHAARCPHGSRAASPRAGGGTGAGMKKLMTSVRIALRALKVNRTRSALTMLGIVIGVAAVIAMVGVGTGATERIQEQIESIGSNLIIVLPGSLNSNGVRLGSGGVATLTQDDAKALAAECPSVVLAAPTVRGGVQVVYGNNNWATTVQGVTPDYLTLRDYTMQSGEFFTAQDVDAAAKTAVLGET